MGEERNFRVWEEKGVLTNIFNRPYILFMMFLKWVILTCCGLWRHSSGFPPAVLVVIKSHVSSGCGRFLPLGVSSRRVTAGDWPAGTAPAPDGGHCHQLLIQLKLPHLPLLHRPRRAECEFRDPPKSLPSLKCFDLWLPIAISFCSFSLVLLFYRS